jgi:exosome complex component RRP4
MKELLLPGEAICENEGYIRGHGTQSRKEEIVSSYFGRLRIINRLVSVEPAAAMRYMPEVGDVVVGRVASISNKRWKIEMNSRADVTLGLSAISLPGVAQRRKLESDEISMRTFFDIGDLIVAEVQKVNRSGSAALHTRNDRYKKLTNGILVFVPFALLPPLKSRFVVVGGVEVIAGANGLIWVARGEASFEMVARIASRLREMAARKKNVQFDQLIDG